MRSSPYRDLDVAAFKAGIEDVFKYKIRTDVRKARTRKLLNVVEAYENKGAALVSDESPTGKSLTIRGMDGDTRWKCEEENRKGIVQLLKEMGSEKKIGSYGLRAGTIGGWAEVRKALLAVHRKALNSDGKVSDETQLVIDLEKAVDNEMEANRQGFGSADFFHELCDPAYFHLWLSGSEFEHGGVKDFIPHYVSYPGKLVLAVEGGTDFVPVRAPLGGKDTFNADIGAAGNIGLRAIADPQRWDIFPRLRTKKVSETEVRVTNWRGWFGKLPAEERLMRAASVDAIAADPQSPTRVETRKKGKKKSAAKADGTNSGENADSESGQSSEYPPFFVAHPEHDWLPESDCLKKEAFKFKQGENEFSAYPQDAYLKRVEQECTRRIEAINDARIQKSKIM